MKKLLLILSCITTMDIMSIDVELTNHSGEKVTASLFNEHHEKIWGPTTMEDGQYFQISNIAPGEYKFQVQYMVIYQSVAGISSFDSTVTIDDNSNDFYIAPEFNVEHFEEGELLAQEEETE